MVTLTQLWLPIVLSAVGVFIVSSIVHMVLKYHASDWGKLENEDAVMAALRQAGGLPPGNWAIPRPQDMKDMGSPEMMEKYQQGPVAMLNVWPNRPPAMGKSLVQWFLFILLISFFVAYLTGRTVAAGADYLAVFRVAGTVGFMAYGLGEISDSIWKGQSWSTTAKSLFDALLYGLTTAGFFGWLWP